MLGLQDDRRACCAVWPLSVSLHVCAVSDSMQYFNGFKACFSVLANIQWTASVNRTQDICILAQVSCLNFWWAVKNVDVDTKISLLIPVLSAMLLSHCVNMASAAETADLRSPATITYKLIRAWCTPCMSVSLVHLALKLFSNVANVIKCMTGCSVPQTIWFSNLRECSMVPILQLQQTAVFYWEPCLSRCQQSDVWQP